MTSLAASGEILERLLALHPKRIDLVLDRIQRLLAALGHPERNLPPVLHVAGTNGKGSTCAFARAMLEAQGFAVHVYTSPHLVHFHERIRIASRLIGEEELAATLDECERVNAGAPITFFEITTAAAFLAFSRHPADALVLEVGLGGKFDATNVIDYPRVTAITPLGLDHQVSKVRAWRAQREASEAAWQEAAFSTDTWLKLSAAELAELSEQIIALLREWYEREAPEDGTERQPVFVFAHGVPATP